MYHRSRLAEKRTPFPMIYGLASKSVDHISITDMKTKKEYNVKLKKADGFIVWFTEIDENLEKVKFTAMSRDRKK